MKVETVVVAVLALLIAISPACAGAIVDAAEVAAASARGAIVWDVRSAEEYAAGHIPGAVNIGALNNRIKSLEVRIDHLTAEIAALSTPES